MKNCFSLRLITCLALAPFVTNAAAQTGVTTTATAAETKPAVTSAPATGNAAETNPSTEALSYILPMFQGIRMITPIKIGMAYRTPADLNVGDQHMRSLTYNAEVGARFDYGAHMLYGSLDYTYTDYHFSGVAPFSDTERLRLYARYGYALDEKWGLFVDASGSLAAERNANLGDGASGRIGGGVSYAVSSDLNLYFGLQVASRLEDSPLWLPYIGLEWKVDPRWSVNVTNGLVISYDVWADGELRFDLACTYQSTSFRMVDTAWGQDRALESREIPLVLSATHEFGKMGYVRASIGGILYSKYKFRSSERKVGEFRVDPAAIFGIEAGIRF